MYYTVRAWHKILQFLDWYVYLIPFKKCCIPSTGRLGSVLLSLRKCQEKGEKMRLQGVCTESYLTLFWMLFLNTAISLIVYGWPHLCNHIMAFFKIFFLKYFRQIFSWVVEIMCLVKVFLHHKILAFCNSFVNRI